MEQADLRRGAGEQREVKGRAAPSDGGGSVSLRVLREGFFLYVHGLITIVRSEIDG